MSFHPRQTILFLLGVLLALSYAHAIKGRPSALDIRAEEENDDACPTYRAICSAAGTGIPPPAPLVRRMKLPGDFATIDQFMQEQTLQADNVVIDDTTSTAVFSNLNLNAVNWAVREMCGCTALIVVSEKAVYFTHYFENLAFCGSRDAPSDFQGQVLTALDNGAAKQESLRAHASDFVGQPGLAAIIMTPTTGRSPALQYRVKVQRLQAKVNELVGTIPKVVSYVPEDCATSSVLGTNALGTALFQYDPNQSPTPPESLSKAWVERSDEYEHSFNSIIGSIGDAIDDLITVSGDGSSSGPTSKPGLADNLGNTSGPLPEVS